MNQERAESRFRDNVIETYGERCEKPVEEDDRNMLKEKPFINVIAKQRFDQRVEEVFKIIGETLARSYGPYGATTLISQYPFYHMTKDGYTIMKSLAFDKTKSFVDQIICGLAGDICGRLNYSVGDGTTTAVVTTNAIFQAYREMEERSTAKNHFLPRDVMAEFENVKKYLISKIQEYAVPIGSLEKANELKENIAKVVFIASNGNQELTSMISELYEEVGGPYITVTIAADGVTKKNIVEGYQMDCVINDPLYINNDERTMSLRDTSILIYDHKITMETYRDTLVPMSQVLKNRGQHLICLAPFYDSKMLETQVRSDLRKEYQENGDINLVLMTCKYTTEHHKKMLSNLAMLCNTEIISPGRDMEINDVMGKILSGTVNAETDLPFILDRRCIDGNFVLTKRADGSKGLEPYSEEIKPFMVESNPENAIRIGYIGKCSLGQKQSVMSGFIYEDHIYQAYLKEAEKDLMDTEKKYQKLGTFNVEVNQAQERLNALRMRLGVLEVGSDSEFTQGYLRDAVDDCVKASRSAYKFGVVNGCSVSILKALREYFEETFMKKDPTKPDKSSMDLKKFVFNIYYEGFTKVYRTLFDNMNLNFYYPEEMNEEKQKYIEDNMTNGSITYYMNIDEAENVKKLLATYFHTSPDEFEWVSLVAAPHTIQYVGNRMLAKVDIVAMIIDEAIQRNEVFDLTTGKFSKDIINSSETDIQILQAVCDLTKLLVTGNQLVVSSYGQYNA